jgi:hypothetical protein
MMPINSDIALQARPVQMQEPAEAMSRVMQLKNMAQQNQMGQVQLQNAQMQNQALSQDQQDQQLVHQAYMDVGGDIEKLPQALAGKVSPKTLMSIQQSALEQKKKLSEADTATLGLWQQQSKVTGEAAAALKAIPQEQRAQAFPQIAQQLISAGIPQENLKNISLDDATLDSYITMGMGSEKATALEIQRRNEAQNQQLRPLQLREQTAKTNTAELTQPDASGLTPAQRQSANKGSLHPITIDMNGKPVPAVQEIKPDGTSRIMFQGREIKNPVTYNASNSSAENSSNEPIAVDTNSGAILAQTGLSQNAFLAGTGKLTSLPRDAKTRTKATKEWQDWAIKNGIDSSTFETRYKAYNDALDRSISIMSNTKRVEDELIGTIDNLEKAAKDSGFNSVRLGNVIKKYLKGEVNDAEVMRYAVHLNQLQSDLASYNAVTQGRTSTEIRDIDDAKQVLKNGIAGGSFSGMKGALIDSVSKMGITMEKAVDRSSKAVWDLFGVGQNYKRKQGQSPTNTQQSSSPSIGTIKTFPNGKKGKWDGQGWEVVQ